MWDAEETRNAKRELNVTQVHRAAVSGAEISLLTSLGLHGNSEIYSRKQTASSRTFDRHKLVDFYEKD